MQEVNFLYANGKIKIITKAIQDYEKSSQKLLETVKQEKESGKNIDDKLGNLTKQTLQEQNSLMLIQKNSVTGKSIQNLRESLQTQREKLLDLIETASPEKKKELIQEFKKQEKDIVEQLKDLNKQKLTELEKQVAKLPNITNTKTNNPSTTIAINNPVTNNQPQTALLNQSSGGKPGMNDSGSTQVTKPDNGSGNSCSKLYTCKINCGKDMVDRCIGQSANKMYQLMSCRGNCLKYNLFYGCGMEAGCDQPCWQTYEQSCGQSVYNSCVSGCENTFGDCQK